MEIAIEHNFSQIDKFTVNVEDSWGKIKNTLLDILNNSISKMKIAPRKPYITERIKQLLKEE